MMWQNERNPFGTAPAFLGKNILETNVVLYSFPVLHSSRVAQIFYSPPMRSSARSFALNTHTQAKARPRDFKQPPHPDAASQIVMAGVGSLVCLASEGVVRQYESDKDLPPFDQVFEVRCEYVRVRTYVCACVRVFLHSILLLSLH